MNHWVRFRSAAGQVGFGLRQPGGIAVHAGELFEAPRPTGEVLASGACALLAPCVPSKVIALWNNFHALAAHLDKPAPAHPLYAIKVASCVIGPGETIRRPRDFTGKIVYEGELGIVIGRRCHEVSLHEAEQCILGYTCVNDVTAVGLLSEYPHFMQWCRAKGFDTFGCIGPAIATGLDWRAEQVVTRVEGVERQRYALSDMIFPPARLVHRLSYDMTLLPGDVIACGTSLGVGSIPDGAQVEVSIEGIGALSNRLEPAAGGGADPAAMRA
jgi:2-keto-4-pentenoate hydratase/2-oxohepta-3-ene-1,7-dioic acid hydratase in catechol pathway